LSVSIGIVRLGASTIPTAGLGANVLSTSSADTKSAAGTKERERNVTKQGAPSGWSEMRKVECSNPDCKLWKWEGMKGEDWFPTPMTVKPVLKFVTVCQLCPRCSHPSAV